jgi:hypothetical protein
MPAFKASIALGAEVNDGKILRTVCGGGGNDVIDFPDAIEKQRHSMAKIDAGR